MLTITIYFFFISASQLSFWEKMKLTKQQLYLILHDLKPNITQYPDLKMCLDVVADTLKINPDEKLSKDVKTHLYSFKRFCKDHKNFSFDY